MAKIRIGLLALTAGLLLGGCPFDPAATLPGGSTGGTFGGGAVAGSVAAFEDELSVRFPSCDQTPSAEEWKSDVLRLVNQARAGEGQAPLIWNETLERQASQYACELIHYDFFDHDNPVTGSNLAERTADFGYRYVWIGENLAAGQQTPEEAVTAWLNSPCHRKNILHPAFTELGVGIRTGGDYGIYWVQEFGRPPSEGPYTGPAFTVPGCAE